MTQKEYDNRYAEALDALKRKHVDKIVSDPEYTPAGYRFVLINGVPCNDAVVFALSWDKDALREAMDQKPS